MCFQGILRNSQQCGWQQGGECVECNRYFNSQYFHLQFGSIPGLTIATSFGEGSQKGWEAWEATATKLTNVRILECHEALDTTTHPLCSSSFDGSIQREADVDSPAFFLATGGGTLLCGFMRCRHGLTPVYMSGLSGNTVPWSCATVMQLNYDFLVCVGFRRAGQHEVAEGTGDG